MEEDVRKRMGAEMSDFTCPHCKAEVSSGDIPDHFTDMISNRFGYECGCGCTFDVDVDWYPRCTVLRGTIKIPDRALSANKDA